MMEIEMRVVPKNVFLRVVATEQTGDREVAISPRAMVRRASISGSVPCGYGPVESLRWGIWI